MRKYIFVIVLVFISGFLTAQTKYTQVRIHTDRAGIVRLAGLGIAMDDGSYKKEGYWQSIIPSTDVEKARNAGFTMNILQEDFSKAIGERNKSLLPEIESINRRIRAHTLKTVSVSN